jgi:hypothetical protein
MPQVIHRTELTDQLVTFRSALRIKMPTCTTEERGCISIPYQIDSGAGFIRATLKQDESVDVELDGPMAEIRSQKDELDAQARYEQLNNPRVLELLRKHYKQGRE